MQKIHSEPQIKEKTKFAGGLRMAESATIPIRNENEEVGRKTLNFIMTPQMSALAQTTTTRRSARYDWLSILNLNNSMNYIIYHTIKLALK